LEEKSINLVRKVLEVLRLILLIMFMNRVIEVKC